MNLHLLNAIKTGKTEIVNQLMGHPHLLNQLRAICENPKGWRPGLDREFVNANGAVDPQSLGYEYTIQTTTQIRAEVIMQKFYEVPIAEFVPVIVGTGAWMESIKTNLTYDVSGDFESGIADNASGPASVPQVDVGVAPKTAVIKTWNKGYQYSLPEVQKALAADNWDVIRGKMEVLKRQWDLGLQKVAFLGLLSDAANVPGLLTNSEPTVNTAIITGYISDMSADDFATFVAAILAEYFANSNSTVLPDTFAIPMADYLGLVAPVSATFPNVSKLSYLEMAFKQATQNPNFRIRGLAYCDQANNAGYVAANGKNRYVLYRNDRETLKMDLPVDFTLNAPGTANNYQWQGVGVGQFTGAIAYRVPEIEYFDWAS